MPADCQACGACCFSDSSSYVPLTPPDRARLGGDGADLIHEEGGAFFMAMVKGRCAALRVGARFSCSIYARRPEVCRELERGTPACAEERLLKRSAARRATNGARRLT